MDNRYVLASPLDLPRGSPCHLEGRGLSSNEAHADVLVLATETPIFPQTEPIAPKSFATNSIWQTEKVERAFI